MAFDSKNLSALAYSNGFTLWDYSTTDSIATMNSAGYFNEAANMLKVRDVMYLRDTSTPTTSQANVLSNTGTVVDVSDGTAIVETDTD